MPPMLETPLTGAQRQLLKCNSGPCGTLAHPSLAETITSSPIYVPGCPTKEVCAAEQWLGVTVSVGPAVGTGGPEGVAVVTVEAVGVATLAPLAAAAPARRRSPRPRPPPAAPPPPPASPGSAAAPPPPPRE